MEQYEVIALATGTAPPYEDCQTIPADASFIATHKKVFGPASKEECEAWVAGNCGQVPITSAQPQTPARSVSLGSNYLPSADTTKEIESNKGKIIALGIYLLLMVFVSVYPLAGLMMAETDKTKIDAKLGRSPTPIPTPTAVSTPTATPAPSPTAAPTVAGSTSGNSNVTVGNINSVAASPTKTPTATSTPNNDQNLVKADIPAEVYVEIPLILSRPLSADGYVLLVVIFSGMLGAVVRAIYSFVGHLGFKNFSFNWAWFYISLPFSGAALSLVIYFVMRGGFYGGPLGKGLVLNLFSFAALAALTGLFTDHAMEKLKQVATTLLSEVSPKVGNAKDIVEKKEADKVNK